MSSKLYLDQIYSKSGLTKIIDTSSFDSNNFFESSNTGFKVNYQSSNAALEVIQSGIGNAMTVNTDKFVLDKDGKVTSGLDIRNSSGTTSGLVVRAPSTQATNTNKALRIQNNSDVNTIEFSYKGEAYFAENISIASGFGINFAQDNPGTGTTNTNNLLDDYEEGDFSFSLTQAAVTVSPNKAQYIRIGKLVYISIYITHDNTFNSTTAITVNGTWPFLPDAAFAIKPSGSMRGFTTTYVDRGYLGGNAGSNAIVLGFSDPNRNNSIVAYDDTSSFRAGTYSNYSVSWAGSYIAT